MSKARRTLGLLALVATAANLGCESAPAGPAPEPKAAEKKANAEAEAAAARKAEREAQREAEEAAATALAAKLDAITVLPENYPEKLDKACDAMLQAYDGFMRKVLQGDQLTKWETGGNEMQLAVFRKECLRRNPQTAACQAHALSQATPELEQSLPDLMKRCAEKHGSSTEGSRPPG